MICTCDNCHYTFESATLPLSCPDCGKESVNRRFRDTIRSTPAVRPATSEEIAWYEDMQLELEKEIKREDLLKSVDSYGMTDEEHNWAMVMVHQQPKPKTDEAVQQTQFWLRTVLRDPQKSLEYYLQVRKEFTRNISAERSALERDGRSEPFFVAHLNDDGETELVSGLDAYGSALSILYHFKPYDFLHRPTLGDLRRINLKRIAENPTEGYSQFLLDWVNGI